MRGLKKIISESQTHNVISSQSHNRLFAAVLANTEIYLNGCPQDSGPNHNFSFFLLNPPPPALSHPYSPFPTSLESNRRLTAVHEHATYGDVLTFVHRRHVYPCIFYWIHGWKKPSVSVSLTAVTEWGSHLSVCVPTDSKQFDHYHKHGWKLWLFIYWFKWIWHQIPVDVKVGRNVAGSGYCELIIEQLVVQIPPLTIHRFEVSLSKTLNPTWFSKGLCVSGWMRGCCRRFEKIPRFD